LPDDPKEPQKAGEGQFTDKQLSSPKPADKQINSDHMRQLAIRSLLENSPVGVDDKLTTLKAAHHVDKDRFQSAFRSLMRDAKS
jgi:hypothetical protein